MYDTCSDISICTHTHTQALPTDLAASIPHGDGVVVRRRDPGAGWVCPAELSAVVLDVLGRLGARELISTTLTEGAHVEAFA